MAAGDPDIGTGTSIAFSTSFLAKVLSIDWSGISRAAIGTSNMATTTAHTFMPGDLYDAGSLSVEMIFKSNASFTTPISAAAETITITFPDSETWACSGFMTGFGITARNEELITASATLKFTGAITP